MLFCGVKIFVRALCFIDKKLDILDFDDLSAEGQNEMTPEETKDKPMSLEAAESEKLLSRFISPGEDFLNALYNGIAEAVFAVSFDTRQIVYWNKGAELLFRYSSDEVLKRTTDILYSDYSSFQRIQAASTHAIEKDGYWRGEVEFKRQDSSLFPAEVTFTFLQTETQDTYVVAVIRDITERKETERKLRERDVLATMGSIAARLVHEIGNPLSGMLTTVQLLERQLTQNRPLSKTKLISKVQRLETEIDRLKSLLEEFRSFSRPIKFDPQPTDLSSLISELLEIEAPQYTERGVTIMRELPPDLPLVYVDGDRLKQALLNLCRNAVEAMPEGGVLTLQGLKSLDRVILEVSDTGVGIPDGIDVFELFKTTKPDGTGLGLPIVRQIISAHGGMINCHSRPGEGTTFRLTLPLNNPS
jgi:PAS domain S-box-containing protein